MRRCNILQSVQNYDTLASYLWRYKGGHCDLNGGTVTNRRGGSTETAQATIHREAYVARWRIASIQDTRRMARQVQGPGQVHRSAAVPETRGKLTRKLALPVAPRLTPEQLQPTSANPCVMLPVCILRTMGRRRQAVVHRAFL